MMISASSLFAYGDDPIVKNVNLTASKIALKGYIGDRYAKRFY
jgi:hypothetical protein